MHDDILGYLRQARAGLLEQRDNGGNSRELSITLTEIDTAILWRQEDLRLKTPPVNEKSTDRPKLGEDGYQMTSTGEPNPDYDPSA